MKKVGNRLTALIKVKSDATLTSTNSRFRSKSLSISHSFRRLIYMITSARMLWQFFSRFRIKAFCLKIPPRCPRPRASPNSWTVYVSSLSLNKTKNLETAKKNKSMETRALLILYFFSLLVLLIRSFDSASNTNKRGRADRKAKYLIIKAANANSSNTKFAWFIHQIICAVIFLPPLQHRVLIDIKT